MRILRRFWSDQRGSVQTLELILIATVLGLGLVVGLATVRNAVVLELGDTAQAIRKIHNNFGDMDQGSSSPDCIVVGSTPASHESGT